MALSKPTDFMYSLLGAYLERLYSNPLKTKAITSCIIAALGNIVSQKLSGTKRINQDNVIAFALFGLLFDGPVSHYFYAYIRLLTTNPLGIFLIERFIYMPCYQAIGLYMLGIFEGKSHRAAYTQMEKLYLSTLLANLKYLIVLQYINIKYVPPVLRVLVTSLIGFAWVVYLANKKAKISKQN